jgi:hypothetical protein
MMYELYVIDKIDKGREAKMIDESMAEFPVIYTNPIPRIAFGWGAYETVGDECKNEGIKKALIVTSGLKGTLLPMFITAGSMRSWRSQESVIISRPVQRDWRPWQKGCVQIPGA